MEKYSCLSDWILFLLFEMKGYKCLKEACLDSQQHSEVELPGFYLRDLEELSIKFWLILDLLV